MTEPSGGQSCAAIVWAVEMSPVPSSLGADYCAEQSYHDQLAQITS